MRYHSGQMWIQEAQPGEWMRAGLRYCDNHVVMKFFSKYLFLWWHELANSLRLLRLHSSFLQIINNFSLRQRFANIIVWTTFP